MNTHINKKRIIKFDLQKYFIKLFNNPLGRWYLGVPQGKHIYKITKSSVHYYTGEIAKNGLPIICTGECSPGGQIIFNKVLRLSKVVSCIAFLPFLPKILFPLIALTDTGFNFPSAYSAWIGTEWTNPGNIYADDANYAVANTSTDTYNKYSGFGFAIPTGSTINGLEAIHKTKVSAVGGTCILRLYIFTDSLGNNGNKISNPTTTETEYTVGGSSDLWSAGGTPSVSWFNGNSNLILGVQGYNTGGTISVNFVKIKIYYTTKVTYDKTVQVKARIKISGNDKTIQTKARIKVANNDKTVQSKARIKIIDNTKTVQAKALIVGIATKTIQAKANIFNTASKTIQSKARIKIIDNIKDVQAKGRILVVQEKTVQSKARVKVSGNDKTSQAKARIKTLDITKTVSAKGRIKNAGVTKIILSKARILVVQSKTISVKARIKQQEIGSILGLNKNTNIPVGTRSRPNLGLNKNTGFLVGKRLNK